MGNIKLWIFLGIVIIFLVFVLYDIKKRKKYEDYLMNSKPKRFFKYLDTFYYTIDEIDPDGNSTLKYIVFHVIEDIDSKKIYAINMKDTNIHFQKNLKNIKILKGNGFRSNWKEASYNDKGSFWIDEELNNCYVHENDMVIINYQNEKYRINVSNNLFNTNHQYNISLLDKAIFIKGLAFLDMEDNYNKGR